MPTRILIRPPTLADQREFLKAARASERLHKPWITAPTSPSQFRAYIERMAQPGNAGFLICSQDKQQIIGVVNLTNTILGAFRSAYLAYYIFAGHEGQGNMREGLSAVVRHAFKNMKLHRLEANIQPDNLRSIRLVQACGFSQEGFSPRYLKIDGRWRDHERWAILAS